MEEQRTIDNVLRWFNIAIRVYFIFLLGFLVYTNNTHPELLNAVSERPPTDNKLFEDNMGGIIYPNWMFKASTQEECKPMTFLYQYYKTWFEPFIILLAAYAALYLIVYVNDLVKKKGLLEEDNENKTEPKE